MKMSDKKKPPCETCHIVRLKKLTASFTCQAYGLEQYVRDSGEEVCIACGRAPVGGERGEVLPVPDYEGRR
jgi:hypothetical protein